MDRRELLEAALAIYASWSDDYRDRIRDGGNRPSEFAVVGAQRLLAAVDAECPQTLGSAFDLGPDPGLPASAVRYIAGVIAKPRNCMVGCPEVSALVEAARVIAATVRNVPHDESWDPPARHECDAVADALTPFDREEPRRGEE